MSYRSLVLVVLLALWPGAGHAQTEMPPGVAEGTAACISERLGSSFAVTRVDPYILVDGELAFGLSRTVPNQVRGEQVPKVGGDEIAYWFGDDPLWPPVLLRYSAPMPHGSRSLLRDPLWIVGLACLDAAYPRHP